MASPKNPFDFDVTRIMAEFKVPGVDVEAVMTAQRRNIEALTSANQLAIEGMQAVARRQAEILRQTMEEMTRGTQSLLEQGPPEERLAKQTDLVKVAFEKALSNMRELAEMVAKANTEAANIISRRVAESLDEMKHLVAKRPTGRP